MSNIASPMDFEVQPEEFKLPSGKTVLVRRPDLVSLISGEGDIPDVLTGLILAGLGGQRKEFELTRESVPEIMKSLNVITIAALVQPKAWDRDEPDEAHVPVAWIAFEDKAALFAWALGADYEQVRSFRDQKEPGVAVVSGSNGVPPKAKRNPRPAR